MQIWIQSYLIVSFVDMFYLIYTVDVVISIGLVRLSSQQWPLIGGGTA